jgi:metal-responsive CopG/Arc/MetJ family transcriptional regulator
MRHKITDDMKKDKTAVSIDDNLLDIFNEYLKENNISNKSKYIESLIRKDMEQRGKNIDRKF